MLNRPYCEKCAFSDQIVTLDIVAILSIIKDRVTGRKGGRDIGSGTTT